MLEKVEAPVDPAPEVPDTLLQRLQKRLHAIIYHPIGVKFIIVCIVLNTICMALDHHDEPLSLERCLRTANWVKLHENFGGRRHVLTKCPL